MKITRERHGLWAEYKTMPKKFREEFPPMVGKWHYHYENKNGRIGLVKINDVGFFLYDGKKMSHYYEACGVLEYRRFKTKQQAEVAIFAALGEEYPGPIGQKCS